MTGSSHIIAIDGPSGSGKSTTARLVAQKLGFIFLDTGAMYRSVTLLALEKGIRPDDSQMLGRLAESLNIHFEDDGRSQRVFINGRDITNEIRDSRITSAVSEISAHPEVRKHMVALQKEIGRRNNIVAEGRDMTSVVFPDATLKVYLDADIEERARRRMLDYKGMGKETTLEEQIRDLRVRDGYDSRRKISPLTRTSDSIQVDTTNLTIEDQVNRIVELFKERVSR